MGLKHLQSRSVRVEIAHMHRIAVSQTGGVKSAAIVVDTGCAVNNLILAVAIYIGYCQIMIPLPHIGFQRLLFMGVEQPAKGEFPILEVPGSQRCACVITATHHHAGTNAVEVGHTGQIAFRTVGIGITPRIYIAQRREVVHGGECFSGGSFKDGEIFRAAHDSALRFSHHPTRRIATASGSVAGWEYFFTLFAPIGLRIAQYFTGSVFGAVGCFTNHFGLSVAIQIVHHKLCIVGSFADIFPQINFPKKGAVEFVGLEHRFGTNPVKGIVDGSSRHVNHQFVLSVAIQIGRGAVVGRVAFRGSQRDRTIGFVMVCRQQEGRIGCLLPLIDNGTHRIAVIAGDIGLFVEKPGRAVDGLAVQFYGSPAGSFAIEVKGNRFRIIAKQTPTHKHFSIGLNRGNHAPVQFFHFSLRRCHLWHAEQEKQKQGCQF